MGVFDHVDEPPRRTMVLFFIADTSGSMSGEKIASLNTAVREVIPYLDDINSTNPDALIKVAAMEFSSGVEWMYPQPMEAKDFQWRDLEAGGLTCLGEAYAELNSKLSTKAYMNEAKGSYAPCIILMSDGQPTDDYKRELEKLRGNNWFKAAIKIAINIGEEKVQDVLKEFTGNEEAVLTVHTKEQLKKIIHFVSVTASKVASKSSSVGTEAPESKQDETVLQINEGVQNDPTLAGVDVGTEVKDADWQAGW